MGTHGNQGSGMLLRQMADRVAIARPVAKYRDLILLNSLEQCLRAKSLNQIESMNALQDAGIISDLCVFACDVAESDCMAAIAFLTFRGMNPKPKQPVEQQAEMPFARQPYRD